MKTKKKQYGLIISLGIFGAGVLLLAGYKVLEAAAGMAGLACRSWMLLTAAGTAVFLLPLSLLSILLFLLYRFGRGKGSRYILSVCAMAVLGMAAGVYVILAAFLSVMAADSLVEKETYLGEGVLEGRKEAFLGRVSDRQYRFYKTASIFFKRPYTDTREIVRLKLEQKYGESFILTETGEGTSDYDVKPEGREISFHVKLDNSDGTYIADDYVQARALELYRSMRSSGALKSGAELYREEDNESGFWDGLELAWDWTKDFEECAKELEAFFRAVGEDKILAGEELKVSVIYRSEWGEQIRICFDYWENMPERYLNQNHIYERLSMEYEEARQEHAAGRISASAAAPEEGIPTEGTQTEEDYAAVEAAWLRLYNEVFRKDYAYDCRYNAKGNFYALLMEGKGRPDENSPEMAMDRTVVYDRVSKNGKCHIFVNYETYYKEDGSEYAVRFLDFYAVTMQSGEVFRADKHSWEETGNERYREATGE